MEPTTVGGLGILMLLLLLFAGLPIGFTLGVAGFSGLMVLSGPNAALGVLTYMPYSSTANFLWTCVPLFILMGHLAFVGGYITDLYEAAQKWLGWLPGGLCVATIAGCASFAAASGSSVATAGTMGRIALPEMTRLRYDIRLSTGCVAAAGTLGSLIPPSIFMVVYGMLTETSIGKLFMAGFIPGVISAGIYMAMIIVRALYNPSLAPRVYGVTWKERLVSTKGLIGIVIIATVVLGGIYAGLWTPTEAGAAGAFSTLILTAVRGRLTRQNFNQALTETIRSTCSLFVIVIGSMIFARFMAVSRIPAELSQYIIGSDLSPLGVFIGVCVLYVFLGCFLEPIGMMLLTLPIIFPMLVNLGYDPIWFGILIIKFTEIGMITPPVGLNVYILKGVTTDVKIEDIFRGVVPFLLMDILTLALLFAFPMLSLWLPSTMR